MLQKENLSVLTNGLKNYNFFFLPQVYDFLLLVKSTRDE